MRLQTLDELRAEVVSIVVRHELYNVPVDFFQDFVDKRLLGLLKVVLQKPGADFFLGQRQYVSVEHLELEVWVLVGHFDLVLDLLNEFIIGLATTVAAVRCRRLARVSLAASLVRT